MVWIPEVGRWCSPFKSKQRLKSSIDADARHYICTLGMHTGDRKLRQSRIYVF